MSLTKASVYCHDFDECRFDVAINDNVWYLRAKNEVERQQWCDVIEANKVDMEALSLRRHGSLISLSSGPSLSSTSSFRHDRNLKEKVSEMETFRDILYRQIDTLQSYFDECAEENEAFHDTVNSSGPANGPGDTEVDAAAEKAAKRNIDFRGEAMTFKATTAGLLNTLSYCVEIMSKREDAWTRKLDREHEKRKRLEEQYRINMANAQRSKAFIGSPDFEEGPESGLTEEEFFDAVEAELDKQDRLTEDLVRSRSLLREAETIPKQRHQHSDALEKKISHHLKESLAPPCEAGSEGDGNSWELLIEEGEMKVYRRELVIDGLICDPLKATHRIKNVTAHEMCHYFWDTDVRMEWEGTIESFRVLEIPEEYTSIIYQTHKRVWPAAQRDCMYISQLLKIDNPPSPPDDRIPHDMWIVCNFSIDYEYPDPVPGCVRCTVDIALICQTFVEPPKNGGEITRDCLTCDIVYVAEINPGGWAPAAALRAIAKRELPKFLRRFTAYVTDKTRNKDILF